MPKYIVKNTTIRHNGKLYKEGSKIDLEEDEANKLSSFLDPTSEKGNKKQENKKENGNSQEPDSQNNGGNE